MSHADPSYPGNEITKDEWDILRRKPSTSTAINIAKNINIQNGFSVGETLIVLHRRDNKPYTTNDGVTPQKFMIIYKDECGMVYCKRITGGRLGKGIEIIATWDHKNVIFMQDPDIIEHVLLGSEADYDPFRKSRLLANLRQRITKHNNMFALRFDTNVEAIAWMNSVQIGYKFWSSNESGREELEIIEKVGQGERINLKIKHSNGHIDMYSYYNFTTRYHKYYKEQPRVFKEECDGIELIKQRKQRKKKSGITSASTP